MKRSIFTKEILRCAQNDESEKHMLDKLNEAMARYEEVNASLMKPEVISDRKRFASLSKEMKDLEKINSAGKTYKKILQEIESSEKMIATEKDKELIELAESELEDLEKKKQSLEETLKKLLVPKDPKDSKNAILEIRAGTGGDEAALFAGDLFRMYTRYCEKRKWKVGLVDISEGPKGGFKEIIAEVNGEDAYGTLKFESGVHRVQRVPKTEANGRIHTSAATVAVLPEAEEVDIDIKDSDIRKDTFMSGGPGGQSVNTTYSAIRLTHIPTGLIVSCQDEKSQIKNYEKALRVLRSRLYEMEMEKRNAEIASKRKSLVSTGDRSAKIRTYNFPQSRVTDHRIGVTIHNLDAILDGNIGELIEQLRTAESAEKMRG